MYPIRTEGASEEFAECWIFAGKYINLYYESQFKKITSQLKGSDEIQFFKEDRAKHINWLRDHLSPPFIEHLSFIFGNQIFFIQLYDVDRILETPNNNISALLSFARKANAIPCLLPMKKIVNEWQPQGKNWCLVDPLTNNEISPEKLITNEEIEMSDWEIQDISVTEVKNKLERDGKKIMSFCSDRDIDPSIWFYDEIGSYYVVIRSGKYPKVDLPMPSNIEKIKNTSESYGVTQTSFKSPSKGYFVSVIVANALDNSGLLNRGIMLNITWNTRHISGEPYKEESWSTEI